MKVPFERYWDPRLPPSKKLKPLLDWANNEVAFAIKDYWEDKKVIWMEISTGRMVLNVMGPEKPSDDVPASYVPDPDNSGGPEHYHLSLDLMSQLRKFAEDEFWYDEDCDRETGLRRQLAALRKLAEDITALAAEVEQSEIENADDL